MYWGQYDNFVGEGWYNISSTDPVKVGIIYPVRTPSHVLGPVR